MARLYRMSLCPFSRKIAMGLREKGILFDEVIERIWDPSPDLLSLSPHGDVPIFIDQDLICAHHYAACEYLEEAFPQNSLLGDNLLTKAHVRQQLAWFDEVFYQDVFLSIFFEKILKIKLYNQPPDNQKIKVGLESLSQHMSYLNDLTEHYSFIAGRHFSWADISAACQISCIDYLGHIKWNLFPSAKEWYMKIKSRPSFRPFLSENFPGIPASAHYSILDF